MVGEFSNQNGRPSCVTGPCPSSSNPVRPLSLSRALLAIYFQPRAAAAVVIDGCVTHTASRTMAVSQSRANSTNAQTSTPRTPAGGGAFWPGSGDTNVAGFVYTATGIPACLNYNAARRRWSTLLAASVAGQGGQAVSALVTPRVLLRPRLDTHIVALLAALPGSTLLLAGCYLPDHSAAGPCVCNASVDDNDSGPLR